MISTLEASGIILAVGRGLDKLVQSFLGAVDPFLVRHQLIKAAILECVIEKLLKARIQPVEGFVQSQHELGLVSFQGFVRF